MTGYYLSACSNRWGTVCPPVQIDGVLFVRLCKSTGYCLTACANRRGSICPPVQKWRGTICPGYYLSVTRRGLPRNRLAARGPRDGLSHPQQEHERYLNSVTKLINAIKSLFLDSTADWSGITRKFSQTRIFVTYVIMASLKHELCIEMFSTCWQLSPLDHTCTYDLCVKRCNQ